MTEHDELWEEANKYRDTKITGDPETDKPAIEAWSKIYGRGNLVQSSLTQVFARGPFGGWSVRNLLEASDTMYGTDYLSHVGEEEF